MQIGKDRILQGREERTIFVASPRDLGMTIMLLDEPPFDRKIRVNPIGGLVALNLNLDVERKRGKSKKERRERFFVTRDLDTTISQIIHILDELALGSRTHTADKTLHELSTAMLARNLEGPITEDELAAHEARVEEAVGLAQRHHFVDAERRRTVRQAQRAAKVDNLHRPNSSRSALVASDAEITSFSRLAKNRRIYNYFLRMLPHLLSYRNWARFYVDRDAEMMERFIGFDQADQDYEEEWDDLVRLISEDFTLGKTAVGPFSAALGVRLALLGTDQSTRRFWAKHLSDKELQAIDDNALLRSKERFMANKDLNSRLLNEVLLASAASLHAAVELSDARLQRSRNERRERLLKLKEEGITIKHPKSIDFMLRDSLAA